MAAISAACSTLQLPFMRLLPARQLLALEGDDDDDNPPDVAPAAAKDTTLSKL